MYFHEVYSLAEGVTERVRGAMPTLLYHLFQTESEAHAFMNERQHMKWVYLHRDWSPSILRELINAGGVKFEGWDGPGDLGEDEPAPRAAQRKLRDTEHLYVRSMGKALKVTAIFLDTEDANRHMARTDSAVVAVFGPFILLASAHDKGVKIDD